MFPRARSRGANGATAQIGKGAAKIGGKRRLKSIKVFALVFFIDFFKIFYKNRVLF